MSISLYLKRGQREYVSQIVFTVMPNSLQQSDKFSYIPTPATQNGFPLHESPSHKLM